MGLSLSRRSPHSLVLGSIEGMAGVIRRYLAPLFAPQILNYFFYDFQRFPPLASLMGFLHEGYDVVDEVQIAAQVVVFRLAMSGADTHLTVYFDDETFAFSVVVHFLFCLSNLHPLSPFPASAAGTPGFAYCPS